MNPKQLVPFFFFLIIISSGCTKDRKMTLSNERFGRVDVVTSASEPSDTVIFFSDSTPPADELVSLLSRSGFLVSVVCTDSYLRSIGEESGDCSYIGGEIERLGQTVQNEFHLTSFKKPVLSGIGTGASLAFAVLAEAPDTFAGAVTASFCPSLPIRRPLCSGTSLVSRPLPPGSITVSPSDVLSSEWTNFEFRTNPACPDGQVQSLVKKTPNSQLIPSDLEPAAAVRDSDWSSRFVAAVRASAATRGEENAESPLPDLPLTVFRPEKPDPDLPLVIFFSGDGGWAWIDKGITKVLTGHGITVAGINSLKYFWHRQPPHTIAMDIARIIKTFAPSRVSLMGYSLGAEVLPFGYALLPDSVRKKVSSIALVGPGVTSLFEVRIGDWLGVADEASGSAIAPVLGKIRSIPVICLSGSEDDERTVCTEVRQENFHPVLLNGGHHFNGDYEGLGDILLPLIR